MARVPELLVKLIDEIIDNKTTTLMQMDIFN